ncbi:MAG TPA: alanine--tRNA ligase, partial [Thermoplasmata archaeon]|nr:alanine--tRNA ligase [Thermoplasmata archaeon]
MPDESPEHDLRFFHDHGFRRQQCASCKSYFWSLGEATVCGEAPCDEYGFIDSRSFNKSLTRDEMRELYLSFFEKRGHTRIHRYPIVARWRKDTFFTNASIYAFQPWVVKGVVEPPANPLVMSQTSVRFNDMDNVGRTGRHLTMFEMMAHHAFNRKAKEIYWKERCTDLCHELLVKELGAKQEDVKYKEEAWQGGGNSGPSLSVGIKGLEVATLVFMQYEDIPPPQGSPPGAKPGKKEMDIYIVDTGYGLERFTWMAQASPNAYEAVFPEVIAKMRERTGLKVDDKVMRQFAKVAGLMDLETTADLRALREKVAKHVGMDAAALTKMVEPIENLYAIVDHTRALAFLLNDGVVPSNAKAGYFARLLVRRAMRCLESLGFQIPLGEIVSWHIGSLVAAFPDLREHEDDILGLVQIEESRYRATVERGGETVRKIEKEKGKVGLEELITLYDSHGLAPDTVKRLAKGEVAVPDDFFQQVAARHESAEGETELVVPHSQAVGESLCYTKKEDLPWEFSANVVDAKPGDQGAVWIVLDKSYFYPEGGGQESDRGTVTSTWDGKEYRWKIVDVQKSGKTVLHRIEGPMAEYFLRHDFKLSNDGTSAAPFGVQCGIDRDRRYNLMRHHTATHVLN